jgi:hypothetical protein
VPKSAIGPHAICSAVLPDIAPIDDSQRPIPGATIGPKMSAAPRLNPTMAAYFATAYARPYRPLPVSEWPGPDICPSPEQELRYLPARLGASRTPAAAATGAEELDAIRKKLIQEGDDIVAGREMLVGELADGHNDVGSVVVDLCISDLRVRCRKNHQWAIRTAELHCSVGPSRLELGEEPITDHADRLPSRVIPHRHLWRRLTSALKLQ